MTESFDRGGSRFNAGRRAFLQWIGSGLLVTVMPMPSPAQGRRGGRRGGAGPISARVHLGADGTITVLTGKVECGQGSRAELTQAAAEELRIDPGRVTLVMADTAAVPDDGGTAGSRTTPSTVPAVRQGCAAAREVLVEAAANAWGVDPATVTVDDGFARDAAGGRRYSYADLASDAEAARALSREIPDGVPLIPIPQWTTLGKTTARPNGRDIVTGAHRYPSDIVRPGMLRGAVLRPPSQGARLADLDPSSAEATEGVTVVREEGFAGVAAPTAWQARKAVDALAAGARWEPAAGPAPASRDLVRHLRATARDFPANPHASAVEGAPVSLRATYDIAYVQHCPMEPRAAVAEWDEGGGLTVWTGTQMPFRVRGELMEAFRLPEDRVRVVVPDFGGGFGGKHSGECAVEAARLARAAGRPVSLRWTREEEFTWAYFRPAAVIEIEAGVGGDGELSSWHFVNVNAGRHGIESPYRCDLRHERSVGAEAPLRHGSYRSLAVTGNTFARECFLDELAAAAGADPLAFRLAHLEEGRLRDVLAAVAERFDFAARWRIKKPGSGVGIACGLDKGSFVAACAEVSVADDGSIRVLHVCQAFECGKILNPGNLESQVAGAILMGLGPALTEAIEFEEGRVTNGAFSRYRVPRLADVPELDIHLIDRPDLPSVGAGETPLVVVAPAVGNAVFHATGKRLRSMPMRLT